MAAELAKLLRGRRSTLTRHCWPSSSSKPDTRGHAAGAGPGHRTLAFETAFVAAAARGARSSMPYVADRSPRRTDRSHASISPGRGVGPVAATESVTGQRGHPGRPDHGSERRQWGPDLVYRSEGGGGAVAERE